MDSGNAARLVWVVGFFQYDDIHNRIRVLIDMPVRGCLSLPWNVDNVRNKRSKYSVSGETEYSYVGISSDTFVL